MSPKKTYRWLTNTWKDAQHHSLLEKCKTKVQWEITSHQSVWPKSKSLQTINVGKGVDKREDSCFVGRNVNWYNHYGRKYSVQFSRSVLSDSLWPHEPQHTRLPCPSPTPGVYSNSCPLSQWCHPTISSSVTAFASRLQSFPASGSFLVNWFFTSGGQSIGV